MASPEQGGRERRVGAKRVAVVGSVGVGKTMLWEQLCADAGRGRSLRLPNSSIKLPVGTMRGGLLSGRAEQAEIVDTPGIHSLFTHNADERVARELLLGLGVDAVLLVLDAKSLRRSLVLALEFAEFGIPIALVLNMVDEAENRGIEISVRALAKRLGLEVVPAVIKERRGIDEIPGLLRRARPAASEVALPAAVQEALGRLDKLLAGSAVPTRALGVLLLGGSQDARQHVERHFGKAVLGEIDRLIGSLAEESGPPLDVVLTESYSAQAERIARQVQRVRPRSPAFLERLGRWTQRLPTGVPIALLILVAMYYWVGVFGATWLVDLLHERLFGQLLVPWFQQLAEPLPSAFVRDALVDDDFGVLTTGLFLAFGIVAPVLFVFYLFFGVLEESGYLPRFSVLVDRLLRHIGLNGKGIIPLIMGLSCVTMAVLTTRMLDTRRERIIATFLLMLGLPCAPLIGVMMVILGRMPWTAAAFVFGVIASQTVIAGMLAARLVPGAQAEFIMELPPMRIPQPGSVLRKTWRRTYAFMKEAVPLFLLAAFAVFLFNYVGGLRVLEEAARPLMGGVLGLPDESVRVFMKTVIRRESGAAELDHLRSSFSNLQLVVALLVMNFLLPCVNAVIVTFKEHGFRTALALMGAVVAYALLVGAAVYHGCSVLGVSFS